MYSIVLYKTSCLIHCLMHSKDDASPKNLSFPGMCIAQSILESQKRKEVPDPWPSG